MTPRTILRPSALVIAVALLAAACSAGSDLEVVTGEGDPTEVPEATATPDPTPEPNPPGGPAPGGAEALAELAEARARWAEAGPASYAYTYVRFCECNEEAAGPFRVVVADGVVQRTTLFGSPATAADWTAEQLFDEIESVIADGRQVDVAYDTTTGMPMRASLDLEAIAVDGGLSIEISSFMSVDELQAELDAALDRWMSAGVDSYGLAYRQVCFCPELLVAATVRDGVVVESEFPREFGPDGPALTVEALFAELQTALDEGVFRLDVTYHDELGFPTEYYVDVEEMIADEEYGKSMVEVTPA